MLRICLKRGRVSNIVLMHGEKESLSGQRLFKDPAGEFQKIVESRVQKKTKKIMSNSTYIIPHVVLEGFKKNSPHSSKNNLQHIQLSDMTGTSNGTGFYGQMKLKNELFSSKTLKMGLVNTVIKSTPCVQWNILLYFLCCGPIFLLEVLDIGLDTWHHGFYQIPTDKKSISDWLC